MSAVVYVKGVCSHSDGCVMKCTCFGESEDSTITRGYCCHDVSAHVMIGIIQGGSFVSFLPVAPPPPPDIVPITLKESNYEERIFEII